MKIIDKAALSTPHSVTCEYCGLYCRRPTERHHIIKRGIGSGNRLDVAENLIDLGGPWDCNCHVNADIGLIPKDKLQAKLAKRLGRTLEDVQATIARLLQSPKDPLKGGGKVNRRPGT